MDARASISTESRHSQGAQTMAKKAKKKGGKKKK